MVSYAREFPPAIGDDPIKHLIPMAFSIVCIDNLRTSSNLAIRPGLAKMLDLTAYVNSGSVGEVVARQRRHSTGKKIRMHKG